MCVGGHSGCFHLLAVVKIAVHMGVQVSVCVQRLARCCGGGPSELADRGTERQE